MEGWLRTQPAVNISDLFRSTLRDGSSASRAAYSGVELRTNLIASGATPTTGWYWLNPNNTNTPRLYWVDMSYSGGGWVCVAAHTQGTGINDAGSSVTYAKITSTDYISISSGTTYGSSTPHTFMASLKLWNDLAVHGASGRNIVAFVSSSYQPLSGSHSRRSRWTWTGWSGTYAWQGAAGLTNEVGGATPGLWSYHIANGYSMTTFDQDNDVYSANCSASYANAPWWYGACWDGNMWGYSATDGYHWTGAGSDFYAYGAIYVK